MDLKKYSVFICFLPLRHKQQTTQCERKYDILVSLLSIVNHFLRFSVAVKWFGLLFLNFSSTCSVNIVYSIQYFHAMCQFFVEKIGHYQSFVLIN